MITPERLFDMTFHMWEKTEKRFEPVSQMIVNYTKTYLKPDDIVLDFGCATGAKALQLADSVREFHGIDISSKMIEAAKRNALEHGVGNVSFERATLFDERYQSASFDVILAFNILHLLEDDRQAVKRIIDLLKPGGVFISATPCLGEKMTFLMKSQFSIFILLNKIRLLPAVKRYKFTELDSLMADDNLRIIRTEKTYYLLSGNYTVAKKII